tara:strand:+ start:7147 stop:7824 length:678 start_codon:yes stop_codon:yes gene_type:complete
VKFLSLFKSWKSILSRLKKKKPSESSSGMPTSLKPDDVIGICVGHSRPNDAGALSVSGVNEWLYNVRVAALLKQHLNDAGISSLIYDEYEGSTYGSAMRWVSQQMSADGVTVAIELHFNSASPSASGCEMLYYHRSTEGKRLASNLQTSVIVEYNTKNRGIKPMQKFSRGGGFLVKTKCPAVICEPFFGSNEREWSMFSSSRNLLAETYARGIKNFLSKSNDLVA